MGPNYAEMRAPVSQTAIWVFFRQFLNRKSEHLKNDKFKLVIAIQLKYDTFSLVFFTRIISCLCQNTCGKVSIYCDYRNVFFMCRFWIEYSMIKWYKYLVSDCIFSLCYLSNSENHDSIDIFPDVFDSNEIFCLASNQREVC